MIGIGGADRHVCGFGNRGKCRGIIQRAAHRRDAALRKSARGLVRTRQSANGMALLNQRGSYRAANIAAGADDKDLHPLRSIALREARLLCSAAKSKWGCLWPSF